MIKAILEILANLTGFLKTRNEAAQAADVKAAAKAQQVVTEKDAAETVVAKRDEDEIRRRIAE